MIDERFAVGAFGSNETEEGGIEIGFWLPNTTALFRREMRGMTGMACIFRTTEYIGDGTRGEAGGPDMAGRLQIRRQQQDQYANLAWCRRYNPVKDGFTQEYQIAFRYAKSESFPEYTKNAYRWAWTC